ncbi:MAG TPA: CPBP family intramembrane glutamic endopeptidase, partial [Thermoanaerobaculia bacterium]
TVLLIGFLPAISEEGISRMFSISFLEKIGAGRWIAILLPAFIWGFGHAAYPNQPFYIRGLEVGIAGVVIGILMVRFGVLPLLAWHFSVDAIYTALLMLRSGNAYYVTSGAIAAGILLLPLAAATVLYVRRGGFESDSGVTNADEGFVPAPLPMPEPVQIVPESRPVSRTALLAGLAAAALFSLSWLLPAPREDLGEDATGRGRAVAVARAFLTANGVDVDRYRRFDYTGRGWAEDDDVRSGMPQEEGWMPGFTGAASEYAIREAGQEGPERLIPYLPPAFWISRYVRDSEKEEWKVFVDAKRGRVAGFLNPIEETAPAGSAPPADRAKQRAIDAAAALGYPASEYTVIEVATEDRPKRRDTRVVLEATPKGLGDLRPRLTAVFHGPRMSAFYPSVLVPDAFLREWRRTSPFDAVLVGVKVVGAGALVGVAVILFIRLVRQPGFRWKSLLPPLGAAAAVVAAVSLNRLPDLMRRYETDKTLMIWRLSIAVGLFVTFLLFLAVAGFAFALLSGARPAWSRALRRDSLAAILPRAAIAAAGLLGLSQAFRAAAGVWPALYGPGVALPEQLGSLAPWADPLLATLRTTFLLAAAASVAALALRHDFFKSPVGRALGLLAVVAALLPTELGTPGEFLASFLPGVAVAAWLAFCAYFLLSDSPAAWLLFGALAFGGASAADLLSQPAAVNKAMGGAGLILLALGVAALLLPRRARIGTENREAVAEP